MAVFYVSRYYITYFENFYHADNDEFTNVIPSNLWYSACQIPKLKCFSSRLAVVFAQSIEAVC